MGLSVAQDESVHESAPSGVDLIRMVQDGRLPPPGVATLLDMRIAEVEEGRVVFELNAQPEFGNPLGTVHGGITARCSTPRSAARCRRRCRSATRTRRSTSR